ncbi:MAG: glycosyltransferase [Aquabacterium sp.]|uniref:glycosyltransferase n=1 Tax=Aquabacterium sp. TaxID=1872578 RepID=UPI003BCBF4C2
MLRVLQISPFAVPAEPRSGGAIRVAESARAYERAGCQVTRACVVTRKRDLQSPLDIKLWSWQRAMRHHWGKPAHLGQLRVLWSGDGLMGWGQALCSKLNQLSQPFDVLHLEHPWAAYALPSLLSHPRLHRARIVYSAHNIESELLHQIWHRSNQLTPAAEKMLTEVRAAEQFCAQRADLCWAVSDADADTLQNWGAKQIVIGPNGCRTLGNKSPQASIPKTPYALFVSGVHQPSIHSFRTLVAPWLAQLPPHTSIVVAGSAGSMLAGDPLLRAHVLSKRLILAGEVSRSQLDQLLHHARAVLLPIENSGGTNLKTAEALLSNRPIIATHVSMRGFEAWLQTPGLHLTDTVDGFRERCVNILSQGHIPDHSRPGISELTWESTLHHPVQFALGTK